MCNKFNEVIKEKRLNILCFLFLMMIYITPIHADNHSLLHPHEANYKVKVRGDTGALKTSVKLTKDNSFLIKNELKTTGLIGAFLKGTVTETADFKIDNT